MKEKFFISIISTLISYLISLIAFYFLFLKLDASLIGIFTFINSIINLGFMFSELGFKTVYYQYSSRIDYKDYFNAFIFLKSIMILTSILLSFLMITIFQLWETTYVFYFLFYLLSMIFLSVNNLLRTNLIATKKIIIYRFLFLFYVFCKNLAIIYLAFNLSDITEPLSFLYASSFLIEFIFMSFLLYFSKNDLLKIKKPKKEYVLSYLKETKYINIRAFLFFSVINIGNVFLDYSFDHIYLAYFTLVYQIITIFTSVSQSLIPIYLSYFSNFFEKNDIVSIEKITLKVEKYSSILFISIIMITYLNGGLFITIFLPNYSNSIPTLYILILIPYLLGISRPYDNQLVAGKKNSIFAFSGILMYSLQILLIIFLIPKQLLTFNTLGLGTIGFGIALTIPTVIYTILSHYFSKKFFNIKPLKQIYFHIPLAIVAFLIGLVLKNSVLNHITNNEILILTFSTLITLGFFFGELFLFRLLKMNDILFFFQLFKLKSYKEALKKELSN